MSLRFHLCVLYGFVLIPTALGDLWLEEKISEISGISKTPTMEEVVFLTQISAVYSSKEDRMKVAALAFERLRNIPDFPERLTQYIQIERAKWKSGEWQGNYDQNRATILQALGGIPDPKVVKLLGEFLSDMEWTSDPVEHVLSGTDHSLTSPNGLLAARSLGKLINRPPIPKKPDNYLEQDIIPWRRWYEGVKAGKQEFSFTGQITRYRFRPDGTLETLSKEGSMDVIPKQRIRTGKPRLQDSPLTQPSSMPPPTGNRWKWFFLAGFALLLGGFFFKIRKT